MSKSVKIEHDGATYTLSFTKRTIQRMEADGFIADRVGDMPATMVPTLFNGAFLRHHPFLKDAVKDEIFKRITDKPALMEVLVDMYNDGLAELVDEPEEEEKKVSWTVEGAK